MDYRERFERGIAEFNEHLFFECHDTLEALWMEERGERRRFLQGVIQGAVGIFHASRRNFNGAESQLSRSIEKLAGYPPTFLGVDVASLRNGLDAFRDSIREYTAKGSLDYDPLLIPTIAYTYDPESMPGSVID